MNKLPMAEWLQWCLVCSILTIFWVGLEYILDGQIINQRSDTALCLFFGWLILDKIKSRKRG